MKKFENLNKEEAKELAKKSINGCKSEAEIRTALTEAGFAGDSAAVSIMRSGSNFMAMVMVWGPNGEIIHA